jgi:DNA-binding winged helix-turn-helix (wHTH) protein
MENQNHETPLLIGHEGPLNGQRWVLNDDLLIGREKICDIALQNRQVSRIHAKFSKTSEGVILEDLDSKNGTHRNGQPVNKPIFLNDGDVIQIAFAQKFIFLSSDATLPLEFEDFEYAVSGNRLRLDSKSRRVWISEQEISPPLSASQFRLLEIIYRHQSKVVPREDVINHVWGEENAAGVTEQALDALVRRLRDRLATVDPDYSYVVTVRGHGLMLDNPLE